MPFHTCNTVSDHSNQINFFESLDDVYQSYVTLSRGHTFRLATPLDRVNTGKNEVQTTLNFQEVIQPYLRQLIAGHGYRPEQQFQSFSKLLQGCDKERIAVLCDLADRIQQWNGFGLASLDRKMSFDFFTEWTHRGASVINALHAFGYALYLSQNNKEDTDASWKEYLKSDPTALKMQDFRSTIEELTMPQRQHLIKRDAQGEPIKNSDGQPIEEGMSLSSAMQQFRRQSVVDSTSLLQETGDLELEKMVEERIVAHKIKMDFVNNWLSQYPSIKDAYQLMRKKSNAGEPALRDSEQSNNFRRECGGTGFLFAMQQAIQSKGISKAFYHKHSEYLREACDLYNEMDKNNFEILMGAGEYKGDVVPSPYLFFAKLNATL